MLVYHGSFMEISIPDVNEAITNVLTFKGSYEVI